MKWKKMRDWFGWIFSKRDLVCEYAKFNAIFEVSVILYGRVQVPTINLRTSFSKVWYILKSKPNKMSRRVKWA